MGALADFAAGLGLPVFPCAADKKPIVEGGFHRASTDPTTIRNMFASPSAKMIGMPTGEASHLIAIDIDIKSGAQGDAWLQANAHRLPTTRTHKTQSGGLHLLFRQPEGVELRNSASRVAPGVDVRASGGYVILPGSPGYTVADPADAAEMPAWLVLACAKPEPAQPAQVATHRQHERLERYTQAAIDGEVLSVMRAGEGTRNDTLNTAAVKLGSLVAAGQVSRSTVEAELTNAALAAGLDRREVAATVKSGLDFGMSRPREMPERTRPEMVRAAPDKADIPDMSGKTDTPLPLLWFDKIEPVLDAKDFVEDVLMEGSAAVVYGESNAGKTFWTTDLALHVATGRPWCGKHIEPGGVVYCVLEGGNGFRNRVAAWRDKQGLQGVEVPFAAIPSGLNLLDPDADTPRLIETIKAAVVRMGCGVKLIVIDTLARAFAGGNENSSEDMGALVGNMDLIRAETGACVLFVHHSGKDQARGARGHSSLRAAIDTEIEVVAGEGEAKTATIVKQREGRKGDVFNFSLGVEVLGQNQRGKDVTTCIVEHGEIGTNGTNASGSQMSRLSGDTARALEILTDLIGETGQTGHSGVPSGASSVMEKWWRERFYDRAKPGAEQETKKKSFRRAADLLVSTHRVGMAGGRVWVVEARKTRGNQ